MTQVRFAPFLPASMQRKRKKFSAAFSGILDHPRKNGKRIQFHPPNRSRRQSRSATRRIAAAANRSRQPTGPRRGAKRPHPSPVLPPPRPVRRQSRPAASRIAGITNRREQPTGALRPPSSVPGPAAAAALSPAKPPRGEPDSGHHKQKRAADRGPSSPVLRPGETPRRDRSPFLVSAFGGKKLDHFSPRRVRGEKYFARSDV